MTERVITYDEVQNHIFIWGALLWVKRSGKVVTLSNCGDYIDHIFLKKLFQNDEVIKLNSFLSEELTSSLSNSFKKLEESKFERERVGLRDPIISPFISTMVLGTEQGSLIDWTHACYNSFYELPRDLEDKYLQKNFELFERSFIVATVSTLIAFTCGYLNHSFLKRVYNTVLLIDFNMLDKGVSQYHFDNFERDRVGGNTSMDSVLLKAHSDHTKLDYGLIEQVTGGNLILEQLIEFHHEDLNSGKGPARVYDSDTGDLQKIVSFCEKLIPYSSHVYSGDDATNFLGAGLGLVDGHERLKRILSLSIYEFDEKAQAS